MVEGIATELLCFVCDEVCKRGAQMKCCGTRACRACAVLEINKNKKCWNKQCGKEDVSAATHLKNDDLLRKAVEHFLKNGKMDPAHEKMLKKSNGKKEKKEVGKEDTEKKEKKVPVDVVEKFKQQCVYGEKCYRKGCLFVHDKQTLAEKKKVADARQRGNGSAMNKANTSKKMDDSRFYHPKTNKSCRFGAGCTSKWSCKFDHSSSSKALDRAVLALKSGIKPMGGDLRFSLSNNYMRRAMAGMGGGMLPMGDRMAGMGGFNGGMVPMGDRMAGMEERIAVMKMRMREMGRDGNNNVEQMIRMKEDLDRMMTNVLAERRTSLGGMDGEYGGGGYGSNFSGRASGRMEGRNFMGRASDEWDGGIWRRGTPISRGRGYGGSSGRYNF